MSNTKEAKGLEEWLRQGVIRSWMEHEVAVRSQLDHIRLSVNPKVSRTIFYCVLISERVPQYILHDSVLFCKLYVLRSRKDVTLHRTKVKTLGGFWISVEKTLPSGVRF